jgi:hypothetical protein
MYPMIVKKSINDISHKALCKLYTDLHNVTGRKNEVGVKALFFRFTSLSLVQIAKYNATCQTFVTQEGSTLYMYLYMVLGLR